MYTYDDIQKMLEKINKAPDHIKEAFREYVNEHTNFKDANSIMDCVKQAYYEAFDRYDSDVCEQFLTFYEKTFDNSNWVKSVDKTEPDRIVTLTVAECGEFHDMGEYYEGITNVDDAISHWRAISPERMNGIPSIGINIHTTGTEDYMDSQIDILTGNVVDLEVLDYCSDIANEPKAIEMIQELVDKISSPKIEVRGELNKWKAAILATEIAENSNMVNDSKALLGKIDDFESRHNKEIIKNQNTDMNVRKRRKSR